MVDMPALATRGQSARRHGSRHVVSVSVSVSVPVNVAGSIIVILCMLSPAGLMPDGRVCADFDPGAELVTDGVGGEGAGHQGRRGEN